MYLLYLGPEGSYSWIAATKIQSKYPGAELKPLQSFGEIFGVLDEGGDSIAVMPIDNKISGKVDQVYDILYDTANTGRYIVLEEFTIPVVHCLLSKSNDLSYCNKIYLHPQTRLQCSDFIQTINLMEQFTATSTSDSVEKASEDQTACAIGSMESAEKYGMNILSVNIGNDKENWTKFVVIRPQSTHHNPLQTNELVSLQSEIDQIDQDLLELIHNRIAVSQKIQEYKQRQSLPLTDPDSEKVFLDNLIQKSTDYGLSADLVKEIWKRLV